MRPAIAIVLIMSAVACRHADAPQQLEVDLAPSRAEPSVPTAGPGFSLGDAPPTNDALAGRVRAATPLTRAGAKVSVDAHRSAGDLSLRARVEFEGAELGLNHERAVADAEFGHVFLGLRELAMLPDDRWLVDVVLTRTGGGGDSGSLVTTEHSVIVVDLVDESAALLWSGADSSLSSWGACTSERTHEFAVADGELVISEARSTELDSHIVDELGVTGDVCLPEPRSTSEVARVALSG